MKKGLKVVIIIAVIFVILFAAGYIYLKIKAPEALASRYEKSNPIYMEISEEEIAEYEASLEEFYKETPSEIEGMTMYDKKQMGLAPAREDTDYDGLTDDEELNVYGSDPLAASTAGDLYSDLYKVEHGMDLFTYAERDMSELTYPNVHCEELTFYPNKCEDVRSIQAKYVRHPTTEELSDRLDTVVYESFDITPCGCDLEIDLTKICKENGITADEVEIYVSGAISGSDFDRGDFGFVRADHELNGEKALLKDTDAYFDVNKLGRQLYLIVDKNRIPVADRFGGLSESLEQDGGSAGSTVAGFLPFVGSTDEEDGRIYAVMEGRHILGHGKYKIYYHETGNPELDQHIIKTMKDMAIYQSDAWAPRTDDYYMNAIGQENWAEQERKYQEWEDSLVEVYNTTKTDVMMKISRDRTFFPSFEVTPDPETGRFELIDDWAQVFWQFYTWDSFEEVEKRIAREEFQEYIRKTYHNNFILWEETLPFGNFCSDSMPGGHCAGISVLTAKTHNPETVIAEKGKFVLPKPGLFSERMYGFTEGEWDLSTDPENATLMDWGLSDFKDADFVDSSGKIRINTEGEQQFLNMIECLHAEMNYEHLQYCGYVRDENNMYDWENVNRIKKRIDDGEILVLGMKGLGDGLSEFGHCVCIIGYEDVNEDEVTLLIYDCNSPEEIRELTVTRVTDGLEGERHDDDHMIYYYNGTFNSDRHWYKFIVADADMLFVTQTRTDDRFNKVSGTVTYMSAYSFEETNEKIKEERANREP